MRVPRIYQAIPLQVGDSVTLDAQATTHVVRVLRLKQQDRITVFNGNGGEYLGVISQLGKREAIIELMEYLEPQNESPVSITLIQGISRGERMDYTLQKAVELGVNAIYPVMTKHTAVNLNNERKEKKHVHWQGVVNSACEQSGRNIVPVVHEVETLYERLLSLSFEEQDVCLVLNHRTTTTLKNLEEKKPDRVFLVAGPEGGFAEEEIHELHRKGFISVVLGSRVLRTETAALAAMSVIQSMWGDFR